MNKHMGGGAPERRKPRWPFAPGTRRKKELARQSKQVKDGVSQMFFVFLKKKKKKPQCEGKKQLWFRCPES